MIDLRPVVRKHEAEIRAFRRSLFSDAADSTELLVAKDGVERILTGDRPAPPRLGPVKSVTDRHALLTVVADVVDQAVMLENEQLEGSLLTFSVAAHHRQLHTRLTVDVNEAAEWVRTILGEPWGEHIHAGGTLSTTATGTGPQRLTTQYFYLFITPLGQPHDPPASFHIATTPLRDR